MPARDHVYLRNMVVDRGGPPLYDRDRKPYEQLRSTLGVCR
jgi:hypothetical protein